ncbi:MAG: amidohydrolase family protein [Chloroflexi bacterium]|nr:amidohydrolase family protein [Chloroflexota bacterium]
MAILDCHVHSWRYPEHFNVAAVRRGLPPAQRDTSDEEIKKQRDLPVETALKVMERGGVDKSLIVGLKSYDTLGAEVPNEYLAEAVKPYPGKLYWAAAVVMTDPRAAMEVEHCIRDLGAVALGEIGPGYAHYSINDPRCFPVYELARSYDIPMLIHAGVVASRNAYAKHGDLLALDEVCVKFPELKIVLCHLGEPDYIEAIHLMSKHPNLYADISGMPGRAGIGAAFGAPPVFFPYFHMDYPLLYYFTQTARYGNKLLWATDLFRADLELMKTSIEAFRTVSKRLEKQGMPKIPENLIENMLHENWKQVFTRIKA